MPCKACGPQNVGGFNGEIAIHFQGSENINEPTLFVFSAMVICRDCGFGEFVVPERELQSLTRDEADR